MQTKQCVQCNKTYKITAGDMAFYEKVKAPVPEYCPLCRRQRRYMYRNERTLFQNYCARCKKGLLTLFNPANPLTVYCPNCWQGNGWDATEYSREIDWNRSLLEQYQELRQATPQLALVVIDNENSDYVNGTAYSKNCYLLFASEDCDNCSYGKLIQNSRDCFDNLFLYDSELCYNCINARNCYRSMYLQDCEGCHDCGFSINLKGCNHVFLSSNLINKEYYIANKPVAKAEYHKKVAELTKDYQTIQQSIQAWRNLNNKRVVQYTSILRSEDCTGDYLAECNQVYESFDVTRGQHCKFVTDSMDPIDAYDVSFTYYKPELIYDCIGMLQSYNIQYSTYVFHSRDCQFCDQVHGCNNLFLSTNAKHKQFLILNKQYSETEYQELLPKLIEKMKQDGEYGHLPNMNYSLFAYNETVAHEYFPLTKAEVLAKRLRWNDELNEPYHGTDAIPAQQLPATIEQVTNDILNQKIICEQSGKAFKITKPELEFYRTMQLPLPHVHPEWRHRWRLSLRNFRSLWTRQCMCTQVDHSHEGRCTVEFETTYSPENLEIVYCEECYQKEIY